MLTSCASNGVLYRHRCCAVARRAGFVAISVQRDLLEASFFGLEGQQPMYTATISRQASGQDDAEMEASDVAAAADSPVGAGVAESELGEMEVEVRGTAEMEGEELQAEQQSAAEWQALGLLSVEGAAPLLT